MIEQAIEAQVLSLITECRGLGVPTDDLDEMVALTRAGEPGVALENLCVQLFEYDAIVPPSVLERLRRIFIKLGLKSDYWTRLTSQDAPS